MTADRYESLATANAEEDHQGSLNDARSSFARAGALISSSILCL